MPSTARRTNEERTEATRRRLLDAAIDCLMTVGYAQTTTVEVSKRAGVSRGAQLHHFPTRADLVTAAVEHLFHRRQQEFREMVAARDEDAADDLVETAIDTLWQIMSGPTFYAWLEILVASRTDAVLREHVEQLARQSDEQIAQIFEDVFQPPQDIRELFEVAGTMVFGMMTGLAAERIVYEDEPRIDASIAMLKRVLRVAFPKGVSE